MTKITQSLSERAARKASGIEPTANSVEQATALVREAIFSGQYAPGERLKVAELSDRFGFSAMPLREALRKLEGEGLIEIERNKGAVVRRLNRQFIEDLYELNAELQLLAVRRGMNRMTLPRLDELDALCDAHERATRRGDDDEALRCNCRLHARIVEIGGNLEALRLFQRGWELINAFRQRFGYGADRPLLLVREHRMLLNALRRQDLAQVEAIIRMQCAAGLEDLLDGIQRRGAEADP